MPTRTKPFSRQLEWRLYCRVALLMAFFTQSCITVNVPKESKPETWPSAHIFTDDSAWEMISTDDVKATFKHRTRQVSLSVISLCDHYLTEKTPDSLLEGAKLSFPNAKPLTMPSEASVALKKIPYGYESAFLDLPEKETQTFLITLRSKQCIEDVVVSAKRLEDQDLSTAIAIAQRFEEGPRGPNAPRFVLNQSPEPTIKDTP